MSMVKMNAIMDSFVSMPTTNKITMILVGAICIFVLPDIAIHVITCGACYVLLFGTFRVKMPTEKSPMDRARNRTHNSINASTEVAHKSRKRMDDMASADVVKVAPVVDKAELPTLKLGDDKPVAYKEAILKLSQFIRKSRDTSRETTSEESQLEVLEARTKEQLDIARLLKEIHEYQAETQGHQVSRLNSVASQVIPKIEASQTKIASLMVETEHPKRTPEHEDKIAMQRIAQFVKSARNRDATARCQHEDDPFETMVVRAREQQDIFHALRQVKERLGLGTALHSLILDVEPKIAALDRKMKLITLSRVGTVPPALPRPEDAEILTANEHVETSEDAMAETAEKIRKQLFPALYD